MNKVLHVLVYLFLVLAAAALYFELQLNAKRTLLTDRNRLQEDYLVKLAKTVEKSDPSKDASFEIRKDASPVEARIVDSPDMENLLEEYPASLEQANLETFNWDEQSIRAQLRQIYAVDMEGNPVMDGAQPLMRGKGTEDELLSKLFEASKAQQARLNSTRAALTDLRTKFEGVVAELNKVKQQARQAMVDSSEKDGKLAKANEEKDAALEKIAKHKSQVDELNSEIASLKDEVQTAKNDAEAEREKNEVAQNKIKQLMEFTKDLGSVAAAPSAAAGVAANQNLTSGVKGKVVVADNENMFAVVSFSDAALSEMRGGKDNVKIPLLQFGVRRPGFKGQAGDFIGSVKIRQEVAGKSYVICDILSDWTQDRLSKGDEIVAN